MARKQIDKDEEKKVWKPKKVERDDPVDGDEDLEDRNAEVNTVSGEIEAASEEDLAREIEKHGQLREPELALEVDGPPPPMGGAAFGGYADTYWMHFDWRADVKRAIIRVQKKFPFLTFTNTYFCHPPVYGRKYEFVSVDFWGGGRSGGAFVGYRGKPINFVVNGWNVFNAVFNDRFLPNIAWIIYSGRMWTRGYGWGPSPWGPADSDAGHYNHIHATYLI